MYSIGCAGFCSPFALGGSGLAALLGLGVAESALVPTRRLTEAAEDITATQDLRRRGGDGPPGRARAPRRRLQHDARSARGLGGGTAPARLRCVTRAADAADERAHERRDPGQGEALPDDERRRLLDDVDAELDELSRLIADVVDLARDGEPSAWKRTSASTCSWRTRSSVRGGVRPGDAFETSFDETVVHGSRERIHRAVSNLLDNAVKWSPEGGAVEVRVTERAVSVRDHGPGIDENDLPHVFDRFYRAPGGARAAGLRPRPRNRAPGGRVARRHRQRRAGGRRRHDRHASTHREPLVSVQELLRVAWFDGQRERRKEPDEPEATHDERASLVGAVVLAVTLGAGAAIAATSERLRPQGGAGGLPGGRGREARRDDDRSSRTPTRRPPWNSSMRPSQPAGSPRSRPTRSASGSRQETSWARTSASASGSTSTWKAAPPRRRSRLPRPDRGGAPRTASQRSVARRDRGGRGQERRWAGAGADRGREGAARPGGRGRPDHRRPARRAARAARVEDRRTRERRALLEHGPGFGHRFGGPMDGSFVPLAPPNA